MAKRFGPYSQYAISESGLFFGFSEDDEELLKYRMSSEVVQAIQESFSLILEGAYSYWPSDAKSTIEYYRELFKNCEVLPNIYYLKKQTMSVPGPTEQGLLPQTFAVSSSYVSDTFINYDTQKAMAFSEGFENEGDILAYNTFKSDNTMYQMNYFAGGSINYENLTRCELAKKEDYSDIVLFPEFDNISTFTSSDELELHWKRFSDKYSLFNTTGSTIADPDDYNTQEMKEQFAGVQAIKRFKVYNNSDDGNYSLSNPRSLAGQRFGFNLADYSETLENEGENSFVFFVKTFAPWYNEDGTIDSTREAVQYWCFNILTLLNQREWGSAQYAFEWAYYKKDNSFISLGLQAKNRINQGPLPQSFYVPFAWYLKNNTRYFNNSHIFGTYSDFSPATEYYNRDWNYETATQNGTSVCSTDTTEFLDFLTNGLGLKVSLSEEEILNENTEDWDQIIPNANVPGSGGQIGGTTGGGSGSGIGETFDDVGAPSTSTRGTYTQSSYILNEINMKHFQEAMVNDSLWTTISNMFKNNPQDGVINLIRFPINFDNVITITNEDVNILGVNVSEMGESGYVRGTKIPNNIRTSFNLGYLDFPERFGSFLDFEPYTKTTIFLPFIGFKSISTDAVIGRRVYIVYDVDYADGSCVCILKVSNKRTSGFDFSNIESIGFTPLYTFDGQIGQIIPITQSNAQSKNNAIIKNALTSAASLGIGLATGGVGATAAAVGVTSAAMNTANTLLDKTQYNSGGNSSSQQSYAINNLTPFVVFDFPEANIPNGFQEYAGYITNLYLRMNQLKGYTQFDSVKITGISCTENEESELKNILESGVIIL